MSIPTYTDFDLYWARKVAKYSRWSVYGIGQRENMWALYWEAMLVDAQTYVDSCVSNLVICNS